MLQRLSLGNDVFLPKGSRGPMLFAPAHRGCIPLYTLKGQDMTVIFPLYSSCNGSTFHPQSIGAEIRHPVSGLQHTQLC